MASKRWVLLLACVMVFAVNAGAAVWDNEMVLSPEDGWTSTTTPYNTGYNVAVDRWNRVHVVWCDNRKEGLWKTYYRRSTNGGITWDVEVSLTDPISTGMQGPRVCVDTFGRVHVVYGAADGIRYIRSTDGGVTWGPSQPIAINSYEPRDQVITADGAGGSGRVHVAWTEDHNSGWLRDVYYRRSTDGGATWVDPVVNISNGLYGYFSLCPSIAADLLGGVHISWHDSRNDPLAGFGAPLQGRKDPQLWGNFEIYYRRSTTGGASWTEPLKRVTNALQPSSGSCIAVDTRGWVHIAFHDERDGPPLRLPYFTEVYYVRSTDRGANFGGDTRITYTDGQSGYPSITTDLIGRNHLIWLQGLWGQIPDVYYRLSPDGGDNWNTPYAVVSSSMGDDYASIAVDPVGGIHLVWERWSDTYDEVYYRRARPDPFLGSTEPSQGRHLVRNSLNGSLHLVFKSNDNRVYYTQSSDNGATWAVPQYLDQGTYPTVGLAWPLNQYDPVICVAYKPTYSTNQLEYMWFDPMVGSWQKADISTNPSPGPPSVIVSNPGGRVYVAYRAQVGSNWYVYCKHFWYNLPGSPTTETIDSNSNPEQPCLTVDGNGAIYGAWKRGTQIWYAPRGTGTWGSKLRVDWTTALSQQPFLDCYGDSVFIAFSDGQPSPSDVWRVSKHLQRIGWNRINVSVSSAVSESPTQAWREFTTWAEGVGAATFDIKYWSPVWGTGTVQVTPDWSYWPQSQMWFTSWTELANAWTEKKNLGGTDYYWVLNSHQTFGFVGGQGGLYYSASAGDSDPSPYCQKRDGVIRYGSMAVDFARDSLVYELPYLDANYDYFLKVSSYRETGSNWAQALVVDGGVPRAVRFAQNRVDTAWIPIPPEAYVQDHKVTFTLKNLQGDYVTSLGLTLYQRDPKPRGKGGPQSGEPVNQPVMRVVFAVYPNPMNAQARVEYSLKAPAEVDLSVYDIMGRLVKTVIKGRHPAGLHRAYWDGKTQSGEQVAKGVYLLRFQTESQSKTTRVVVIR